MKEGQREPQTQSGPVAGLPPATVEASIERSLQGDEMGHSVSVGPDQPWLTTTGFLDKIDENLKKAMAA